jgi:predicted nuclease of restriction endonuclease-like (RecB) superfamily
MAVKKSGGYRYPMAGSGKPKDAASAFRLQDRRFFADVAAILRAGRAVVCKAVNSAMVGTYWQIGRRIVEQEQKGKSRADYGEYLLVNLSRYLGETSGKGFSYSNLRNFRQFYLTFPDSEICYTLCSKLSWSHVRLIMRLDNELERKYYLDETREQNWSVRELERNIRSGYYRRIRSTQRKEKAEILPPADDVLSPEDCIKDPYVLEFLNLPQNIEGQEEWLETAIIRHVQEFLLEAGKGFSFIGRQFHISTETSHFYIDLVFYNYLLKCFVVIDLKTSKLTHQDVGQMDMYVRMFDELKRGADDNPTIGLILCADKDETIVKYSVLKENKRLFASRYKLVLPTEKELADELHRNAFYLRETAETYYRAGR